jgi:tetratricopeptide (TPR) repeat protein
VTGNLLFAARGQLGWGRALIWQFQYEIARQHLNQALAGFRSLGDQRMEGLTLRMLGAVAIGQREFQAWQEYTQQALSIARQTGDRSAEAEAINHLGNIANLQGDYPSAQRFFNKYLVLAREIGSRHQERMALGNLGSVAIALKDYTSARNYHEQSLVIAQAIGDLEGEAGALKVLGDTLADQEHFDTAAQDYLQALELYRGIGAEWGITETRTGLARVRQAQGDMEGALNHVNAILAYLEGGKGLGYGRGPTESYLVCVQVLDAAGDPRVREVLERGHAELQERAEKITDEALRRSFLENVPWNRELVKLWEEQRDK